MNGLDRATLRKFVELAGERLTGDWLVLGGVVVPLLGGRHRVTADIDVAGPDDAGMDQVIVLMEIAKELGLPAETINTACAVYLRDIPDWRDQIVVFHRGSTATIHTPTATLYVLTKLERLSESDLDDCVAMLWGARERSETVDTVRLHRAVEEQLSASPSRKREQRLRALRTAIGRR